MTTKPQVAPTERQAFGGLRIPRPSDPRLRRLRALHQPAHQGWRLWSSTWLLLNYLEGHDLTGVRLLDVGCGWGLAGAYAARRGATVRACDIDAEVLPFARFHAEINDVAVEVEQRAFGELDDDLLGGVDWVVGADICFRGDLVEPLADLVGRARASGTRVVLADPGRAPFQTLAARCVDEHGAWTGPASTPEPLVAWPGERPLVHGRLFTVGAAPPPLAGA
jgi:predicted nicotinamide N-methyase